MVIGESNGNIGLKFEVDNGLAITRAGGCDVAKDKIITQEALSTQLSNYYTKTESDEKYVLKNEPIEIVFGLTAEYPIVLGGTNKYEANFLKFIADKNYDNIQFTINYMNGMNEGLIFRCNDTDLMKLCNTDNSTIVNTIKNMDGVEYVLKTELQQSMTITHLAPIDEELDINSFIVGAPVYMTGKVYIKDWKNEIWNKSSVNDSIDCIPSVKTNGTWKEYLGICTSKTDKEIRFATHGDYLVKVNDSSTYGIGDTVYIEDHEYNNKIIPVLKILSEDIPLTTKINRMTVGIVTSIIDSKTISVFRD